MFKGNSMHNSINFMTVYLFSSYWVTLIIISKPIKKALLIYRFVVVAILERVKGRMSV